ncbi:UDP-N-acetylglucosamine--peptide N-acetylglucosaminyltransferase 110 kDa subunit, partial [Durusdinium trenchii]
MMRCGFHTLSEEKCKKLVQEVTVFDYMDFQDFTDFSEKAILEERKGYRQLLKTWEPNSCDNFVDPVDNVKSFMKMLKVICTRKSVLDILDVAGLKDEPCNSPQEMLRFLAAYQACEGFSKQEVSSLRAAFKSCEEPHAVGPEGRLIDPKSLSFGLLRFGGIYFVEAWRAMKHYQKAWWAMKRIVNYPMWASAAGVSFYEFLVCARRVRETQLQQVAEYVETICGEGENFIEVDFNDNGVLDETEFLRLMRLQKETSVRASGRIFAALAECDIFTENHLLEVITLKHGIKTASVNFSHAGVRRGSGKQPGISWDTWVILAEEEAEVSELRKAFGAEEVPVSDLIW